MIVVGISIPKIEVRQGDNTAYETNYTISHPPIEVRVPNSNHDASSLLVPRRLIEVVS
jgi:hypothetical protein